MQDVPSLKKEQQQQQTVFTIWQVKIVLTFYSVYTDFIACANCVDPE
jgi:hypothetical protein